MTMGTMIWTQKNKTMWDIFDNWIPPLPAKEKAPLDWSVIDGLIPLFQKISEEKYKDLFKLLDRWDKKLNDFGGDPTHYNWHNFRPLRLNREEDWSDWLAHLIDSSKTGSFSGILFSKTQNPSLEYASPTWVRREDIHHGYRADLIIRWKTNQYTHLEVKTGDPHMAKTYATGRMLQNKYMAEPLAWKDVILLLSEQISDWESIVDLDASNKEVQVITWEDVCVALRRSLSSSEPITWKALAYNYLGAIEQHVIGFPGYRIQDKPFEQLDQKIDILTKGLTHEK